LHHQILPGLKLQRAEKYLAGLDSPGLYFRVDLAKQESEKVGFSDQNYSESLLATLVYHYVQLIFKYIENYLKPSPELNECL